MGGGSLSEEDRLRRDLILQRDKEMVRKTDKPLIYCTAGQIERTAGQGDGEEDPPPPPEKNDKPFL
jgi:hypothetical protein